jgi:hypothetical protein
MTVEKFLLRILTVIVAMFVRGFIGHQRLLGA